MIQFILNDKAVQTALPAGSTVLDFVREEKRLKGTKTGCREGDCGACTVLVGELIGGELRYRSMTSCLLPLTNAHGKHILTVEGINLEARLSPAQQALVDSMGTQCGFCTIGFVMSLTGFVLDARPATEQAAITCIDGNICRCTGYKSIERAAKNLAEQLRDKPQTDTLGWLIEHGFVPPYLAKIPARLEVLRARIQTAYARSQETHPNPHYIVGGGTDLLVQRPSAVRKASVLPVFDHDPMQDIVVQDGICTLGASVTVTEFAEDARVAAAFPNLERWMRLISSTPIRNMATIAGNFVNASPIGDMTAAFLALDAELVLRDPRLEILRTVRLRDFYKGYKQLDKAPHELVQQIRFGLPQGGDRFNFEKVCKRTHLDIASVNSAAFLRLSPDGQTIETVRLSAGGVSATPKFLAQTCAFLTGKPNTESVWAEALELAQGEISPISDARGTAAYKRLLLRQLLVAHLAEFFGEGALVAALLK